MQDHSSESMGYAGLSKICAKIFLAYEIPQAFEVRLDSIANAPFFHLTEIIKYYIHRLSPAAANIKKI